MNALLSNDRNVMVNFQPGEYMRKKLNQSVTQAARRKNPRTPDRAEPMTFWLLLLSNKESPLLYVIQDKEKTFVGNCPPTPPPSKNLL